MHDSSGRPLAVLETTEVETTALHTVTKTMVDAEGESFASIAEWRVAHDRYWTAFIDELRSTTNDPAWTLHDDTMLVFERFVVLVRLAASDEGRYPVVELTVRADEQELAAADLYDLDTVGVEELTDGAIEGNTQYVRIRAGFASDEAAAAAEAWIWCEHPLWRPRFEVIVGDDWLDAWREHFVPVQIGRITIVPDWPNANVAPEIAPEPPTNRPGGPSGHDRITLRLDPQRAWGTGAHASTQLAVHALQAPEVSIDGAQVLDVGCGSGVLSIAAVLLGAAQAHGIDVDRTAAPVTKKNAERNGVADRCSAAWEPLSTCMHTYDLVLANILAPVLIELADDLQRVTRPGGSIVLAGLIDTQLDRVLGAFGHCKSLAVLEDGSWRGVILRRE